VAALKDHDELFRELELAHYVPVFDVDHDAVVLKRQLSLGTIHELATAPTLESIHEDTNWEGGETSGDDSGVEKEPRSVGRQRRRRVGSFLEDPLPEEALPLDDAVTTTAPEHALHDEEEEEDDDDSSPSSRRRRRAFAVDFGATYAAYGFVYSCRRALAVAKEPLAASGTETSALSGLDAVLLVSYVAMQFTVAHFGDAIKRQVSHPSKIVAGAVMAAGLATLCTGLAAPSPLAMAVPWALNGIAQALVYPYVCVVLATQIPAKARGRVMGSWNTCTATGGVLGAAISAAALKRRGYRGAFEAPALVTFLFSLVLFAVLSGEKEQQNDHDNTATTTTTNGKRNGSSSTHHGRVSVWRMARVPAICVAYSLLKPIRYLFLFWHNYYQTAVLGHDVDRAALVESVETAFALLGGLAFGAATDRVSPFVLFFLCLLGLAVGLAVFWPVSRLGLVPDMAVVALVSALVGAVDNLASGLTAAALVDHNEKVRGAAASIASVCSFLSACGTLGTIVHSQLLKLLVPRHSWATIFGLVAAQAFLAALLVAPIAQDDLRRRRRPPQGLHSDGGGGGGSKKKKRKAH